MHKGSSCSVLALSAVLLSSAPALAQPAPAPPATVDEEAPEVPQPEDADAETAEDETAEDETAEDETAEDETAEAAAPDATTERSRRVTAPAPAAPPDGFAPMPAWPEPEADARQLREQGGQPTSRPDEGRPEDQDARVFAEDWWSHTRPILELHGYFRVRAELFHRMSLSRSYPPDDQLFPRPVDSFYRTPSGSYGPVLCTADEAGIGDNDDPDRLYICRNRTMAGANMRFRLNPELHISDNLRIVSQIDLLDNLVLGSTPQGYAFGPDSDGGYATIPRGGYDPISALDSTQEPPSSGVNSWQDSIRVKRAWAEYMTPVGELRFGRMPSHWGLGILLNSGDGFDDDYQTTMDRIMFVSGIPALDLFIAGAWDFPSEGATTYDVRSPQTPAQDAAQLDDVDQYVLAIARRTGPELAQLALAKGQVVLNGGAYLIYRKQLLANDLAGNAGDGAYVPGAYPEALAGPTANAGTAYVRRGAEIWIPDVWVQLMYKKFRFELEAVAVRGSIENTQNMGSDYSTHDGWKLRQYGIATELEQKLIEDRLSLQFKFGWASGDPEAAEDDLAGGGGLVPGYGNGMQGQYGDDTYSTFRFHPNYKVDLILHRNILTRVQGDYYFRPSLDYDFMRSANGQRFGGGIAAIWSRASEFMQTPGHRRDLGIELDGQLYFQSKDGALNDAVDQMGGFYTMLQYGVLFPLGGLGYQSLELDALEGANATTETRTAQIVRWYLGVIF